MQHHLYPPDWKQRVAEADLRAEGRSARCGALLGTLRVSRKGNLYFLPLHTSHVNHDPENPQAELRKLCPRCHGKTHPWLHGKRDRRKTHRFGYPTVSVTQLSHAARAAGLFLEPGEAGYIWRIASLSGTAPDILDAISQALHCLHLDYLEHREGRQHG
jgi:hypothetical protein